MTNESEQHTRRQVLTDTFFSRAQADADQIGGRFKKEVQTRVTGVPSYPSQPASSPFAKGLDEVAGPEPELGYEIDAIPALGGSSLAAPPANQQVPDLPNLDPAGSAGDGSASPPSTEQQAVGSNLPSTNKRRTSK